MKSGNEQTLYNISFLENKSVRNEYHNSDPNNFNNNMIIKDNYLTETKETFMSPHTKIFGTLESTHEPKLFQKLTVKDRQKSYLYNILVLSCFNINMAHFCFHYLTHRCGIVLTFIILIGCALLSYVVQNSLVKHISANREIDECNYAMIIEHNFGNFCANFLEFLVMIWYGILLLICLRTVMHLIFFLLADELKSHINSIYIAYYFTSVIVFLLINRAGSFKIVNLNVIVCIFVNVLSLLFYFVFFIINCINDPNFHDVGDLIILDGDIFFDAVNIFTGGLNTIIVFFWVNNKLSDSSVRKHSQMFSSAFGYIVIYYVLFILLKFFPINICNYKMKFILYPDYENESKFVQEGLVYYMSFSEIILNIVNQIFMLNFYFIIIKSVVFRKTTSQYLRRKKYFLWFTIYLLIITGISFAEIHPYTLLIINNGTIGMLINYLLPCLLYIKLSSHNFLSFGIVARIMLIFAMSTFVLTSFYKNILNLEHHSN